MGISGLLPFIKNSCRSANVRDFHGATVAIDAYSWLHKGAFSCAEKLVKGEKTDGYVYYCAKLLNMLLDAGVRPIMVFDGCNLRSKEVTEKKRKENREKTRQRGKELLCEGKIKEARECFQRCVDVTPEMAREVIEMCRKKSIDCIVAPYEADAQLAYLDKIGMAQIIITEDSDLALFGCSKILFKMDSYGGGLLYEKENLPKSFGSNASKFSFDKFRYMCILSGCDYLPSLPGIGLAKACKFFMLTTNLDLNVILKKLPSYLKMPKLEVSDEYIDSFIKANNTFLYQLVFCPQKKALVPLSPYPEGVNAADMEYAGKYLPEDIAVELAIGNINVKTLKTFETSENDSSFVDKSALWGSSSDSPGNKLVKKVSSSGFKFGSQKIKATKRKVECLKTAKEGPISIDGDEELFAMYRNVNSKPDSDDYEEDPLGEISPKKPKLSSLISHVKSEADLKDISSEDSTVSLKRVIRSRFFASKSESTEISGVLRENSPENLNNTEVSSSIHTEILADDQNVGSNNMQILKPPSPVKSNKENISHMFAKKKVVDSKPSGSLTSDDITSSLTKVERSWLDAFDTKCSTVSSSGMSSKVLSLNAGERSKKETSDKNFVKIKKTKLISTKILDFKWNKESAFEKTVNSSLLSDGNSVHESFVESEDDLEVLLNTSQNEVSPCSSVHNSYKTSTDCDILENNLLDQSLDDLPSSSNSTSGTVTSQNSVLYEMGITHTTLKQFNSKPANKPGKCRQLGLSRKSKSLEKKVSVKETLMNFNFIRKPKSETTSPT